MLPTHELKDICEIRPAKSQSKENLTENDMVSFVPMNVLGINKKYFSPVEERPLGSVYKGYTYFADGDVLLAKITPCFENGKLGVATGLKKGVGFGSSEFVVLRSSKFLVPEYLYYFLSRDIYREIGATVMTGAVGHKRVPLEYIENTKVPLPPIEEQKRIVSILDEAFAGIDQTIENTKINVQNAREMFESTSRAIICETKDVTKITLLDMLEKGWIISHLDGNHGADYPKKSEFIEEGVPYISANCLKKGQVNFGKAKYLAPERAATLRKGIAKNRDVLFAHNATVGPVALLKTSEDKIILGTSLTYYRCDEQNILPEYLVHYLRSPEFTKQYELVMGQSTRNQVPITKQREFYHLIPPLDIQLVIATRLDDLANKVEAVEISYQQKIEALKELKQSLLQKAFAGELTSNLREVA